MKQDRRVIGYSVIVALGGLLFGLDTAVISGAEQSIQALYKLSDFRQGFTVAIAIIGAVVGAFSAGFPSERPNKLLAFAGRIKAYLYQRRR